MQKRNLILLIIVLVIVVIGVFIFLYFNRGATTPGGENEGTNFISRFNPFASSKPKPTTTTPPDNIEDTQPNSENETSKMKLIKVSSMPIAGFTLFTKERLSVPVPSLPSPSSEVPTGTGSTNTKLGTGTPTPPLTEFVLALRYVVRATGNIYQTFADKIEERKFSGTIIPQVYDAYFGNRGESVVMRYLKKDGRTIETFVGILPKEYLGADTSADNEIKGSFLPDNVKDISLSPDTSKIFYLFNSGDNMIGTTLSLLDNKKVQVFDSPFTEWLSFWPTSKMITLSTKPSAGVPGYIYGFDLDKKSLIKILGGVNGLTTLASPNGKLILYGDNNLSLSIYHTDTGKSDLLGVRTLPEKCVWGSVSDVIYCAVPKSTDFGTYPDAWYQGEISFSDQLWKIDIKNGSTILLLDPVTTPNGEEIDGIKLALDDDENYLFFVNKKDSFLWEFALK